MPTPCQKALQQQAHDLVATIEQIPLPHSPQIQRVHALAKRIQETVK